MPLLAKHTSSFLIVLAISWLGAPVSFVVNIIFNFCNQHNVPSPVVSLLGFVVLATIGSIVYQIFNETEKDPYFYGFAIFGFVSVVDLLFGLEIDGFVSGFMAGYKVNGEPYLVNPFGALINYWDGTGLYAMYLTMCWMIISRKDYKKLAIYWSANMINSLIVLLFGLVCGKIGISGGTALNIPFLMFPIAVGWTSITGKRQLKQSAKAVHLEPLPLGLGDIICIMYFIFAVIIAVIRAMVALGSPLWLAQVYGNNVEPHLLNGGPTPFLQVQMLVYFFYHIPLCILGVYGLNKPTCTWMTDVALILAGSSAQGQVTHIGVSVHWNTPQALRVPSNFVSQLIFWPVNLILLLFPQFLVLKCVKRDESFRSNRESRKLK